MRRSGVVDDDDGGSGNDGGDSLRGRASSRAVFRCDDAGVVSIHIAYIPIYLYVLKTHRKHSRRSFVCVCKYLCVRVSV